MKNNEDGEFELVLGNRQLLSGFFVVVILFAVFFVMGYIVGRNSAPAPKLAANSDASPAGTPVSQTRPPAASASEPAAQSPPQAAAQPVSQPARQQASKAETPAPAVAAAAEPVPGET